MLQINEQKTLHADIKKTKLRNCTLKAVQTVFGGECRMVEELKARMTTRNKCCFAMQRILNYRFLCHINKITVYEEVIRSVVTCSSETWVVSNALERKLLMWERVSEFFTGSMIQCVNMDNGEYMKNLIWSQFWEVQVGKIVAAMPRDSIPKRLLDDQPGGKNGRERPHVRWLDEAEEILKRLGIRRSLLISYSLFLFILLPFAT